MERLLDAVPTLAKSLSALVFYAALLVTTLILWRYDKRDQARHKRIEALPEDRQADFVRVETGKPLAPGVSAQEALKGGGRFYLLRRNMFALEITLEMLGIVVSGLSVISTQDDQEGSGPMCLELECNGQDPEKAGCAVSQGRAEQKDIIDNQDKVVGWVALRFSGLCDTNWAQIQSSVPNLLLRTYLRDKSGIVLDPTMAEARALGIYGKMWFAPTGVTEVQACGVIEGYVEVCTGLH